MKNVIFIAPPAAGKGTQSELLVENFNYEHISTGDLLRVKQNDGTILGNQIKELLKTGKLIADEIVTKLLKEKLINIKGNFILDGYPRNIKQAKTYNELLDELNYDKGVVIFFDIDKQIALKRTLSRIVCQNCGSSYNLLIEGLKPLKENICDRCNHELKTRTDDTEEVFINRFDTYLRSTKELIEYYKDLGLLYKVLVEEKSPEIIFEEVKEILNND